MVTYVSSSEFQYVSKYCKKTMITTYVCEAWLLRINNMQTTKINIKSKKQSLIANEDLETFLRAAVTQSGLYKN